MFNLLNQGGESAAQEEPQRRKLQLQPRTKSLEAGDKSAAEGEESAAEGMSDEDAKRKVSNDVKEYLAIRDINEGVQSIEALPEQYRTSFVEALVAAVLDKKQDNVDDAAKLLGSLREQNLVTVDTLHDGFKEQVTYLDDTSMDAPSAYSYMAQLLVRSGLPREKIDSLADGMQGEGLKPPKDRLLAKVDEQAS